MKKLLFAIIMTTFLLTGCKKDPAPGPEPGLTPDTPTTIVFKTSRAVGETITLGFRRSEMQNISMDGAKPESGLPAGDWGIYTCKLSSQTVTIKGDITLFDCRNNGINEITLTKDLRLYDFNCSGNELTSLDVSGLTELEYFACPSNRLTSLNIEGCDKLCYVECYSNSIKDEAMTEIVNDLPKLDTPGAGRLVVTAEGCGNVITAADVAIAKAKNWVVLDWYNNEYEGSGGEDEETIPSVTFGAAADKTSYITFKSTATEVEFYVPGDETTEGDKLGITLIDVEGATVEEYYYANGGVFGLYSKPVYTVTVTTANAGDEIKLYGKITDFVCFSQKLTALDVSKNEELAYINISGNTITGNAANDFINSLPDRSTKSGGTLIVMHDSESEHNGFTTDHMTAAGDKNWNPFGGSVDDSNSITVSLSDAAVDKNVVFKVTNGTAITVTGAEYVSVDGEGLMTYKVTATTMKIVGGYKLFQFNANDYITSLDASNHSILEELYCSVNPNLTSLNVSGCTALKDLRCTRNKLASLDVTDCTNLKQLYCFENELTSLNISGLTLLNRIECDENKLTSLDVSSCKDNLKALNCSSNQLSSLNISGFAKLTGVYCYSNQLTALDITGCSALNEFRCHKNKISKANMNTLVSSLPNVSAGEIFVYEDGTDEGNGIPQSSYISTANSNNWKVYANLFGSWMELAP